MELSKINSRIEKIFTRALNATYPQRYKIIDVNQCDLGDKQNQIMSVYIIRAKDIVDNVVDKFEVMINPNAGCELNRIRIIRSSFTSDSRLATRLDFDIFQLAGG